MRLLFTLLSVGSMLLVFPQESKVYFEDALQKYLVPYNKQSSEAINNNDYERAEYLFDSLMNNHLKGSFIPNRKLDKVAGGTIDTDSLKMPFLLITKPSWFNQTEEIEAINVMATEYKNQLVTIVLYWDRLKQLKKLEKKYNKDVILTYIDETENRSDAIVKTYKHAFGAPVCYFVSHKKQLVSLSRKFELSKEISTDALVLNSSTYKNVTFLLFEYQNSSKGTITTLDDNDDNDY